MYVWIVVPYHFEIAPEERMVAHVKPNDGRKSVKRASAYVCTQAVQSSNVQSNVSFCKMLAEDERAFALSKNLFHLIKVFEKQFYILFVHFLVRCEADLVYISDSKRRTALSLHLPCKRCY